MAKIVFGQEPSPLGKDLGENRAWGHSSMTTASTVSGTYRPWREAWEGGVRAGRVDRLSVKDESKFPQSVDGQNEL
jgi:hypothetical protein